MTQKIVFFDVETTGLDADSEIIEYAAVGWSPNGSDELLCESRVLPTRQVPELVAKINGYDPMAWRESGARAFDSDHLRELYIALDGALVCGSNPGFDKARVTYECSRLGLRVPKWSHRECNLSSMAFPLYCTGKISSTGLDSLANYFGASSAGARHTALGDCKIAISVFEELIDAYVTLPEETTELVRGLVRAIPTLQKQAADVGFDLSYFR